MYHQHNTTTKVINKMITTKIDKEKILSLPPIEWVAWVEPFKKIIPSYPMLALRSGVHHNTITGVLRGTSNNEKAKEIIIDAIEEALGELQQAAMM